MDDIEDIDYFPDCMLPECQYTLDCQGKLDEPWGVTHQHILPKQQQIMDSTTKYLFAQGGVGSAKSIAFAAKAVKLSLEVRGNEGAVCRKQLKDAYKSTWRDVLSCIKRLVERGKIFQPEYTEKTQGQYSKITFRETQSIIYCIPGKNWSDALGPSYGWFWVDDCMECYSELFIGDDTNAGLISRLRLPHVHFDKNTYDADLREHGSLHGMVSTNPPPIGHWSHKLFGDKPGLHELGDDFVEWIRCSNTENPFTGLSYSKGLIAIQKKMGGTEATVRRIVFGESVPAYGGVPVFPQFKHTKHVSPLKYNPDIPLIRSWDFGHQHPAVTFSHLYTCRYRTHHFFTLSEIADAYNLTVYDLYKKYVKPHTERLYAQSKYILDCGDRSGYRASASNRDGRSDMKILMGEYNLPFKWRYMNLDPSLQYMRGLLQPKSPCPCGMEMILISPNCPVLIGALEGGYRFQKPRASPTKDKPYEDRYFADVACAWRYGAENYQKWGVSWDEQKEHRQTLIERDGFMRGDRVREETPWAWTEATDEEIGSILTS